MFITLQERIVERNNNPASKKFNRIVCQSKKIIDSYVSDIIPRIGETICLEAGAYDVVAVIHYRTKRNCLTVDEVILEVIPHNTTHFYKVGGYVVEDNWPLISELETIETDETDN